MKRSLESLSLQMWQRSSEQTPLKQQSHSWRQETGSWLVPTILDRGGTVYNRVVKLQASRSCFLLVFQKSCGTNHCPQSIRLSLSAICFVLNVPFMLTTIPSLNWWAGHLATHDSTIGYFYIHKTILNKPPLDLSSLLHFVHSSHHTGSNQFIKRIIPATFIFI